MEFFAVLTVLVVVIGGIVATGALVGWLGMLALGIAGISVAFLSQAWPIGIIVVVIARLLFGGSND